MGDEYRQNAGYQSYLRVEHEVSFCVRACVRVCVCVCVTTRRSSLLLEKFLK